MHHSLEINYMYDSSLYLDSFVCCNCGCNHRPRKTHYIFTYKKNKFCCYDCKMKYIKRLNKEKEVKINDT